MATRHAFDWNTGPGDGTVPARYSSGITATVGDTLVLSWLDPTTTPAGPMFHEVVPMPDDSCTFANGYTRATQTDITNAAGVKTAISSTITLDKAGVFYFSCGVGSAAWCSANTTTVQAVTGGAGCTGQQAWHHCGAMFKQKVRVIVNAPAKTAAATVTSCLGAVGAATAMVLACWNI